MKSTLTLLPALVLLGAAYPSSAAEVKPRVYALCTVRDLAFDQNSAPEGKVYRSEVFSARADYDTDISPEPERASKASAEFEQFVFTTYGLRDDRSGMKGKSEHYCIEAPDTPEGRLQLEATRREWDSGSFPAVELVLTNFIPAPYKPSEKELEFQAKQKAYGEARAQYEQEVARNEAEQAAFQRDVEATRRSAEQTAKLLQAHAEEVARAQAAAEEYRLKREEYVRQYREATGMEPPQ